jgi:hypothetical protein
MPAGARVEIVRPCSRRVTAPLGGHRLYARFVLDGHPFEVVTENDRLSFTRSTRREPGLTVTGPAVVTACVDRRPSSELADVAGPKANRRDFGHRSDLRV